MIRTRPSRSRYSFIEITAYRQSGENEVLNILPPCPVRVVNSFQVLELSLDQILMVLSSEPLTTYRESLLIDTVITAWE